MRQGTVLCRTRRKINSEVITMPRVRREKSESGIYHIMVRGIDKMNIFLDREDRYRYLDTLQRYLVLETHHYELYAFCLMSNHVHLLIKEFEASASILMQSVGVSYAYYFNQKYARIGHLFQDRYRSEVIDSDPYFLACCRYIHNNPVAAGLVSLPEAYQWSSYGAYLGRSEWSKMLESDTLLSRFGNDMTKAIMRLREFTAASNDDAFLEYKAECRAPVLPRSRWGEFLSESLKSHGITLEELKQIKDVSRRNQVIHDIKSGSNLPVRELSQLIGLSKDVIFRA